MIYFNISLKSEERAWRRKNGRTRRELLVINKLGQEIEKGKAIDCRIGKLDKGNSSFLFLNKEYEKRTLGIFLNDYCGFSLIEGEELWSSISTGGAKNKKSKMGIYVVNSVLEVHTYNNNRPSSFFKLGKEGWIKLEEYELCKNEAEEV